MKYDNCKGEIMPGLLDIARVSVGKHQAEDAQKALIRYSRTLYRPPLTIKNKLKTQVNIGDESCLKKFVAPPDSDGIFASWRKELNRKPAVDYFEHQPLNKVKVHDEKDDIKQLEREIKYRDWLKDVDARMRKLGFKA